MLKKSITSSKLKRGTIAKIPRELLVKNDVSPQFHLTRIKGLRAWQATGTIFTGSSTVFLGRYINLNFPEKSVTSNAMSGTQRYDAMFKTSTDGLYGYYVVTKVKLRFILENLDGVPANVYFLQLPYPQALSTDTAVDYGTNAKRKILLGCSGNPDQNKVLTVTVDFPKLAGQSYQQYCSNNLNWSKYGTQCGGIVYGYLQFLKLDNSAWANGVNLRVEHEFDIQPMSQNALLRV